MEKSATLRYINLAIIPSDSDLTNKNPPLSPPNKKFPAVSSPPKYSRTATQRHPSPLRQKLHFPRFRFPPISQKNFRLRGKFSQFYLFPQHFFIFICKKSDDLF